MTFNYKHILGFWHEQSRYDRDEFVKINWDNIRESVSDFQFEIREKKFSETFEKNLISRISYDYCSLMHYSEYAGAKVSHQDALFISKSKYLILFRVRNPRSRP